MAEIVARVYTHTNISIKWEKIPLFDIPKNRQTIFN